MKRRVLIAIGCTLALLALATCSYYWESASQNLIAVGLVLFWVAVGVGIVIRIVRAKRGAKIRGAFAPVAGAIDVYQSMVLGRPTVDSSTADEARSTATDRFTSGPGEREIIP